MHIESTRSLVADAEAKNSAYLLHHFSGGGISIGHMTARSLIDQIAYMSGVAERAALVADASNTSISRNRSDMFECVLQSLRELHQMKEETSKFFGGFGPGFSIEDARN